jgi:hypothetical protein
MLALPFRSGANRIEIGGRCSTVDGAAVNAVTTTRSFIVEHCMRTV